MRIVLRVLGILLILIGGVWFFQGVNVLPGSFMTGQIQWAVYGVAAVLVGLAMMLVAQRRTLKGA